MWVLLFVTFCAYFVQSTEKNNINEDFGPLHIRVNTAELPTFLHPKSWVDRRATRKAITLVDSVRSMPEFNPLKITNLGPYDISIPDLHINGNVSFQNLIVTGINEVCLQSFDMQVAPPRIDFNLTIPKITVEADFDLHCPSLFYYDYKNVRELGHFKLTLDELSMSAVLGPVAIRHYKGSVYELETAVITMHINDVQEQYKIAEETIQKEQYRIEDIIFDNDVLDIILEAINDELENIPSKKILKYLIGTSPTSLKRLVSDSRRRSRRKNRKFN